MCLLHHRCGSDALGGERMNRDLRLNLYMMKEHLGQVMDGEASLNILELWQWMDEVLHQEDDEE